MADIVESLLRESQCRISPSWCPAQHIETFTFAIALAENVIDRRCIIEPIDPEEEALDSRDLRRHFGEPTCFSPIVSRSRNGNYRLLNDVSALIATRSLHPRQQVLCHMFDEEKIDSDRFKLIDFRFRVLDAALMPRCQKDRQYRGDKLIHRLTNDDDLCRLIQVYWLNREPGYFSAADKSVLTNGQISKAKFHSSSQSARKAKAGSDAEKERAQGGNREAR